MTKNDVTLIEELFIKRGWKKISYSFYKYMDDKKEYIISASLHKVRKELTATIRFHVVSLNELSCFLWDYHKNDFSDKKLKPLSTNQHIHAACACDLFAISQKVNYQNGNSFRFVEECENISRELYGRYGSIDNLILAHDDPSKYNGTAMILYLFQKNYKRVRDLFKSDEQFPPVGAGDVKLGLWTYIEKNNLH